LPSWRLLPYATTAVKKLVSWVFNNVVIASQKVLGFVWFIKANVVWFLRWLLLLAGVFFLVPFIDAREREWFWDNVIVR
jgi:pilus assembly protein TadC